MSSWPYPPPNFVYLDPHTAPMSFPMMNAYYGPAVIPEHPHPYMIREPYHVLPAVPQHYYNPAPYYNQIPMPLIEDFAKLSMTNINANNNRNNTNISESDETPAPQSLLPAQASATEEKLATVKQSDTVQELYAKVNPKDFNINPSVARFFVIKSFSEDDVHRSIKYKIWCSTEYGNRKLDQAYREAKKKNAPLYLFFSVNKSGHFCGMAEMTSAVDFQTKAGVWTQDTWKGKFSVNWIFIKDIPFKALRMIRVVANDHQPVAHSRDCTELFLPPGRKMLQIFANYQAESCLLDDFEAYDQAEREQRELASSETS